jgi:uncharacterized protein (DUF1330 family)
MHKSYWISTYRAIKDEQKISAYAKLAGPALTAAGGRFLARGEPYMAYELGLKQRTVLLEFDSVEQAVAAHDCPAYQAALATLDCEKAELQYIYLLMKINGLTIATDN